MKWNLTSPMLRDEADDAGGDNGGGVITDSKPASLADVFAPAMGIPSPATVEPKEKPVTDADDGKSSSTAGVWDVARYLTEKVPAGKDLFGEDGKRVESWDKFRSVHSETMKALEAESAAKLKLEAEIQELRKAKPSGAASDADKEAWALEMQALKDAHSKETEALRAKVAKIDLADNHAFKVEFDGKLARLHEEALEVVKAAGLSEDAVKAVFAAKNEYDLVKALREIEDEDAAGLLKEKARSFMDVQRERDAALNAADPVKELAKWQDYEKQFQGVLSARFTDSLKSGLLAAVPEVAQKLQAEDPYFKTAAGQAALREIGARFEAGYDLSYEEVIGALAASRASSVHRGMAAELAKENAALKEKLARFERADPAAMGGEPAASSAKETGGFLAEMFSGRI